MMNEAKNNRGFKICCLFCSVQHMIENIYIFQLKTYPRILIQPNHMCFCNITNGSRQDVLFLDACCSMLMIGNNCAPAKMLT